MEEYSGIAVIGLDGVPPRVLWSIKEYMPSLNNVLTGSKIIDLVSTIPPWTPPAWISMITGVSPARHGIYTFHNVEKTETGFRTELVRYSSILYPPLPEVLDAYRRRGVFLNIPASYHSPRTINSIIVSDWASPSIQVNNPKYQYLADAFSKNIIAKEYSDLYKLRNAIHERIISITTAIMRAAKEYRPQLLFSVFSELDWIMHQDPGFVTGDNIGFYRDILGEIDRLIAYLHDKHKMRIVIVSDHGFAVYTRLVFLGEILARKNIRLASISYGAKSKGDLKSKLIAWVSRHKKIKLLAKKILLKTIGKLPSSREIPYSSVDVLDLGAYCLYLSPRVQQNKVLDALKEYSEYIDTYTCEEAYGEKCRGSHPDIIVMPNNDAFIGYRSREKTLIKQVKVSQHHPIGVLMVEGMSRTPNTANITSVFALLLTLLDIPIPSYADRSFIENIGLDYKVDNKIYTRLLMKKKLRRIKQGKHQG